MLKDEDRNEKQNEKKFKINLNPIIYFLKTFFTYFNYSIKRLDNLKIYRYLINFNYIYLIIYLCSFVKTNIIKPFLKKYKK